MNWVQGLFNGGLPLRYYILNINGVDEPTSIDPSLTSIEIPISTGLGSTYTIKLKSKNDVSESEYSEPLIVPIGVLPNAPTIVSSFATQSSLRLTWTTDPVILNNVPTLGFKIYGKTITMDDYELFKTVDSITTTYTL